ncbi:MAG: hypothetical protein IPJ76_18045 [Flavobacteriales bacterium]|nr:MAG: hypothetical protein IPJ76_18045 [Flavobacteriales bacterium]
MSEGERTEMIAIGHPSLRHWTDRNGIVLNEAVLALTRLSQQVYSDRPALLDRQLKWNYLMLQGLINTLRMLEPLQDRDVFALGQRCPDRLRSQTEALRFSIELAEARYTDLEVLNYVNRVEAMHREVVDSVNAWYLRSS